MDYISFRWHAGVRFFVFSVGVLVYDIKKKGRRSFLHFEVSDDR